MLLYQWKSKVGKKVVVWYRSWNLNDTLKFGKAFLHHCLYSLENVSEKTEKYELGRYYSYYCVERLNLNIDHNEKMWMAFSDKFVRNSIVML
mgnify:CR=1 FL=1